MITSANAVLTLSISSLFDAPQQLQGFSAEDIYTTEEFAPTETMMGLDGFFTGGFTYKPIPQRISLLADSPSQTLFDQWWAAMQTDREAYVASGVLILQTTGKKWTMNQGFLTGYKAMPDATRLLQPRRFGVTWGRVIPAPV